MDNIDINNQITNFNYSLKYVKEHWEGSKLSLILGKPKAETDEISKEAIFTFNGTNYSYNNSIFTPKN